MKTAILGLAFLSWLGSTPVRANVIIVAASGGGDFTSIQLAVNAANDGDVILVKAGSYESFTVGNKSLAIVGEAGAAVQIHGAVRVFFLSAGRTVSLVHLSATGFSSAGSGYLSNGLFVEDCKGAVRVDDCQFVARTSVPSPSAAPASGALVVDSADVAFGRSVLIGSGTEGSSPWGAAGHGMSLDGSNVALYDCFLQGRDSRADSDSCEGLPGGNGLAMSASEVFASNTTFVGGRGGNSAWCGGSCADGGPGGSAVLTWAPATTHLLDDVYLPGAGGTFAPGGLTICHDGSAGATVWQGADQLAGQARILVAPSPVRELATVHLAFRGAPGDLVSLAIDPSASFAYQAPFQGVALTSGPTPRRVLWVGVIPAIGSLGHDIAFPDLGQGVQARTLHLQSRHKTSSGSWILGSFAEVVVLDQAF